MSLVMDMHREHLARRARLGFGSGPRQRLTRQEIAQLPPARTVFEKWGAPITLIGPPSSKTILRLVSLKHGVNTSDLMGPLKTVALVKARDHAIALIYTHCRYLSLPTIGRMLGGRHHTSILHTLRKLRLTGTPAYRWGKLQAPGKTPELVDGRTRNYSMEDRHQIGKAVQ
jgi:hypothetical protein